MSRLLNDSAKLFSAAVLASALGIGGAATSAYAITEQEAQDIAVDAYVYFYPLVTMDVTRKQLTNHEPGKAFGSGPMNMFSNVPTYPAADDKAVVRPNFDTLYSVSYLDLTKEPMVVSVPDTGGRYYLLPMLDMWTRRVRVAGLAHDRNSGGRVPRRAARLAARSARQVRRGVPAARRDAAHRGSDPLRLDHRPHEDRWRGRLRRRAQDPGRAQGHALVRVGEGPASARGEDRPEHRHEDAAQGAGRHDAGRQVLRLCGGPPEGQRPPPDRRADPRPHEADRHRGGQELRHREGRPRRAGRPSKPRRQAPSSSWNGR